MTAKIITRDRHEEIEFHVFAELNFVFDGTIFRSYWNLFGTPGFRIGFKIIITVSVHVRCGTYEDRARLANV